MINLSLHKWPMEKVYRLLNHTKYVRGDFLSLNFSHLVEGTNSFVCSIPLEFAYPLVHPAKTLRHKHGGCMQFKLPLCFGIHAETHFSTPSQHLRKVILSSIGFWWIGTMEFAPHVLNFQINNHVIEVPNLWKPMKYPHMFTNYSNHNQESH